MLTRAFSLLLIPATCAQLLSDLRVNGVAAPLGVSASPPLRFSWRAATTQDSYRVTLRGPTGVVFDTGAKSGGSAFFEYNGTALSPDADFSWDVLLFLRGVGEVGATAAFSTAPAGAPLPGAWVGGFPLLRAPFFLSPARIVRARLHAAGVGCFHAWVNGVRVTDELSPGWGHAPSARSPFYSYDVAPLLSLGGESVLAFALGSCKFGMYGQYCGAGTPDACNAAWALLRVEQEGGNVTALSSSAAWFAGGSGPTVAQHLYAGETHDARLEQEGWSAPGFAPAAPWPPARAMNASALLLGPLVPAITPAAVAGEPLPLAGPPVPLTDRGTAALLYDFSFTAAALCTLDVAPLAPPAGAAFTLTFGEVRQGFPAPFQADTPMYRPFTSNCGCPSSAAAWPSPPCACNCAPQNQTYIAAAKTLHTYTPSFFYSAGRYVQLSVSNWPGAPALGTIPATTVTCRRLYSGGLDPPLLRTSFPSAPALEALQAMTVRTHLANYITVPSDCPHRERRGWTGDGQLTTRSGLINFPSLAFYRHWHQSMLEQQRLGCTPAGSSDSTRPANWRCNAPSGVANISFTDYQFGTIGDVVPQENAGMGSWPGDPSWSIAAIVVPAALLEVEGDAAWVAPAFDDGIMGLLSWFTALGAAEPSSGGLLPWSELGDWKALDFSNPLIIANLHYLLGALRCADVASALPGRGAEAAACVALAARVSGALAARFWWAAGPAWDPPSKWSPGGSQAAQAMALVLGAGGAALHEPTAAALLRALNASGGALTVGATGALFLLDALAGGAGRLDMALALAERPGFPGWMQEVTNATAVPLTAWEVWTPGALADGTGNSGAHIFMMGGMTSFVTEQALGLRFAMRVAPAGGAWGRAAAARLPGEEALRLPFSVRSRWGLDAAALPVVAALAAGEGAPRLPQLVQRARALLGGSKGAPAPLLPRVGFTVHPHAVARLQTAAGWRATPAGNASLAWRALPARGGVEVRVMVPVGALAVLEVGLAEGMVGRVWVDGAPWEGAGWGGEPPLHPCGAGVARAAVEGRAHGEEGGCAPAVVLVPPSGEHTFVFT